MIEFFKGLLGSKSIVEAGIAGIDKAILTEEEQRDLQLKFIEATLPMNVARRFIAIAITVMWVVAGLWIMVLLTQESALIVTAKEFATYYIVPSFVVLVSFYFYKKIAEVKQ
jgi:hypothetical protein